MIFKTTIRDSFSSIFSFFFNFNFSLTVDYCIITWLKVGGSFILLGVISMGRGGCCPGNRLPTSPENSGSRRVALLKITRFHTSRDTVT